MTQQTTTSSSTGSGLQGNPSDTQAAPSNLQPQTQEQNSAGTQDPSANQLQPNASGINNIKTNSLQVKDANGNDLTPAKASNSSAISFVIVIVILVLAAGLFLASLRLPDEPKKVKTVEVTTVKDAPKKKPKKLKSKK